MHHSIQKLDDGLTLIELSGRLDVAGSAAVELPVSSACGGARNVIVDMSGVEFLASIGIRLLLSGAKLVKRRGGLLVLVAPHEQVAQTIEMSGLAGVLPMADDMAQAHEMIDGAAA
ncbi:STAS domain-containing protein [Tistrella sp. BH-R2-4]|jgi:anti-sigma B factor antagonist|uniref:Anti-sigma factor antagonist n=1 Tax=Tistrella arctica TaxID=3133430 RepID=A0ABU9YDE4_9PROT